MSKKQAETMADILGGEAWQSGGNVWLVRFRDHSGKLTVISEDAVCEYGDDECFYEGTELRRIELSSRR